METKKFKPYDKVLTRLRDSNWEVDFYSHYEEDVKRHRCVGSGWVSDNDILPYEGNEHLVGTTDNPDEDVRLEEGELGLFFDNKEYAFDVVDFQLIKFWFINKDRFKTSDSNNWNYAIRFSDFNPNDMEETKKHILVVKNGKIVKYKG